MGKLWEVTCSDAIAFLKSLPDDHVDLIFTSPPYLAARTYGIGADVRCVEEWTAWMVEVVRECFRVCKGLVAVNCEGQTRDFQYLPAPFLLAADLHRAGFNLRRPAYFHRIGIPGSGGPDWLRGDIEPIICVSRPGKLPWSENTACGNIPKYDPGGGPTNRKQNGERVNKFGSMSSRGRAGERKLAGGRKVMTIPREGMHSQGSTFYMPPEIANPGNVIHCNVGGGQMGSPHAHNNEAPFPLKLAEFFVKSFCPPGGRVLDCFMGSGTMGQAAIENGREFIGCDIRQSQCDLTEKRLRDVVPAMF